MGTAPVDGPWKRSLLLVGSVTEQEPDWASDQVVVTDIAPQRNIARFIREIGRGGHRRREENIAHFKIPRPFLARRHGPRPAPR